MTERIEGLDDLLDAIINERLEAYAFIVGQSKVGGTADTTISYLPEGGSRPHEEYIDLEPKFVVEFLEESRKWSTVISFQQALKNEPFEIEALVGEGLKPDMWDLVLGRFRKRFGILR